LSDRGPLKANRRCHQRFVLKTSSAAAERPILGLRDKSVLALR
jgi:hypothetical protein